VLGGGPLAVVYWSRTEKPKFDWLPKSASEVASGFIHKLGRTNWFWPAAPETVMPQSTHALIVIDMQQDFCPGGALAVAGGNDIVGGISELMDSFRAVILTQDWHPAGHSSFASTHGGAAPFSVIAMPYGAQTLWPDHCIQGSAGAAFHPDLLADRADLIIRKGYNPAIDSYSAFFENDRTTPTGLEGYLRTRGIEQLTLCGLALDYCVNFSAVDAARLGFAVTVRTDLCRAIDLGGSLAKAHAAMAQFGVSLKAA
jgi:nicotinamidase/pyrazinamidase